MNNNFLDIFRQNLMNEGFLPSNYSFEEYNVSYFSRVIGNNLYLVIPVKEDEKENLKYFKHYEDKIRYSTVAFNKVFILELVVCEKSTPELLLEHARYDSNFNEEVIKMKWLVDLEKSKVISDGKQPSRVLNISKLIKQALNTSFRNQLLQKPTAYKAGELRNNSTILTTSLILVLSLIYFYSKIFNVHNKLLIFGATTPSMIFFGESYRMITSGFLHLNFSHIMFNCISLYIIGSRVERYMGKANFFIIYMLGMIGANITTNLFLNISSAGASGAIFALMGALMFYSYKTKAVFDGLDFYFISVISIIGLVAGFLTPNTNDAAHIGGLVCGALVAAIIYFLESKVKVE